MRLDPKATSLPSLWREVFDEVSATYPDREGRLLEEVSAEAICPADRFRMGQVFRNVIDNSFAACEKMVKTSIVCRNGVLGGRPALEIVFRDHRPDMDEEQLRRLFEPFYTTRPTGTGLGMAIAIRIIEAHGGRIAAGNAHPGASITIWLPRGSP